LLSYGIAEPETFLGAVEGEVLTVRMDDNDERSVLIAAVHDRPTLRKLVMKTMSVRPQSSAGGTEVFADSEGELSVSLSDDLIVMGSSADVHRYSEARAAGTTSMTADSLRRITFFGSPTGSPNIATYTNDADRIRSFFVTVMTSKSSIATPERIDESIGKLPYSVTETTLDDHGIVRTTRSPLGQFSTLLPLLLPQQPGPAKNENPTR